MTRSQLWTGLGVALEALVLDIALWPSARKALQGSASAYGVMCAVFEVLFAVLFVACLWRLWTMRSTSARQRAPLNES